MLWYLSEQVSVILHVFFFADQVTWLASWTENIQGAIKYVMLNPTSRLKVKLIGAVTMFIQIEPKQNKLLLSYIRVIKIPGSDYFFR